MKKSDHNSTEIIKKHTSAIHIDAKLSLIQRRLSNALLYHAYEGLLTEKRHIIDIPTLCALIGFEGRNRDHLKEALKGLATVLIEWNILDEKGKEDWGASALLASAEMKNGKCIYEYSSALAERLYNPEMYARINLEVQRKITSGHTLALYENCYRFINVGATGWWTLDEFRRLLGVQDLKYAHNTKSLNQKIIKPAIKEINETSNILIEVEYKREKRKVTHVRFSISENPQLSLLGMEEEDEISKTKAYERCLQNNISRLLARKWIIDFGEDYVLEKLDYTEKMRKTGRIRTNSSGFLTKAINEDYKSDETENKKLKAQHKKQRLEKENAQNKQELLEKQMRDIEKSYRKFCAERIESHFNAMNANEQKQAKDQFKQTLSGSSIILQRFTKDGWSSPLIAAQVRQFWNDRYGIDFPSLEVFATQNGMPNIQDIKKYTA